MGPPASHGVTRVPRYSGYCHVFSDFVYGAITLSGSPSQMYSTNLEESNMQSATPKVLLLLVWPPPLSLATTRGISVYFFSSRYLDVSVPGVPHVHLCIQCTFHDSSPWVFPHSEIRGYNAYLQLPAAFRSLSRPSSAPDAKAFPLCSS